MEAMKVNTTIPPPLDEIISVWIGGHSIAGWFTLSIGVWYVYNVLTWYFEAKAEGKVFTNSPLTYTRWSKYPMEMYLFGLIIPFMINCESFFTNTVEFLETCINILVF